jgi:hypothetical protein
MYSCAPPTLDCRKLVQQELEYLGTSTGLPNSINQSNDFCKPRFVIHVIEEYATGAVKVTENRDVFQGCTFHGGQALSRMGCHDFVPVTFIRNAQVEQTQHEVSEHRDVLCSTESDEFLPQFDINYVVGSVPDAHGPAEPGTVGRTWQLTGREILLRDLPTVQPVSDFPDLEQLLTIHLLGERKRRMSTAPVAHRRKRDLKLPSDVGHADPVVGHVDPSSQHQCFGRRKMMPASVATSSGNCA